MDPAGGLTHGGRIAVQKLCGPGGALPGGLSTAVQLGLSHIRYLHVPLAPPFSWGPSRHPIPSGIAVPYVSPRLYPSSTRSHTRS